MTDLAIVNGTTFGTPGAATVAIQGGRLTAVGGREVAAGVIALHRDLLAAGASAIIGTGVALTVLDRRTVHRTEAHA
ncbi:MAG TPA: hypothetical protein VGK16_07945 [Candidatus Limnocylindrales bacterium]|jgi:hypothetical protein